MPPLLFLAALGCSDPVYYPQLRQFYEDNRFDGLPEDTGEASDDTGSAADDTGGDTGGEDTGSGPRFGSGIFSEVPCSTDPLGAYTTVDLNVTRADQVIAYTIDADCAATLQGNVSPGESWLPGSVGQSWAFTDAGATVLYVWIQMAADNPDVMVIE